MSSWLSLIYDNQQFSLLLSQLVKFEWPGTLRSKNGLDDATENTSRFGRLQFGSVTQTIRGFAKVTGQSRRPLFRFFVGGEYLGLGEGYLTGRTGTGEAVDVVVVADGGHRSGRIGVSVLHGG
mmetsp:Transcript_57712/g.154202  ORF Transcript_57712/g.154202 Transcript_57712/m.154202 type:complete len:123 (+) Transcript_57712:66-434(+)